MASKICGANQKLQCKSRKSQDQNYTLKEKFARKYYKLKEIRACIII